VPLVGRRLLFVLGVLAALVALALVTSAAGSTAGSKYKVHVTGSSGACNFPCDFDEVVIRRLDDDRTSCRPFVDLSRCNWTARAGTTVVLEFSADIPGNLSLLWGGDCFPDTDTVCKLVMDSNKTVNFNATWNK
jgi:hypothetical protein